MKKTLITITLIIASLGLYGQRVTVTDYLLADSLNLGDSVVSSVYSGTLVNDVYVQEALLGGVVADSNFVKITADTAVLGYINTGNSVVDSTSIDVDSLNAGYINVGNTLIDSTSVAADTSFVNTYLEVNGNADLNGIGFTGSTKIAGSFYRGTTNPTSSDRLNYDGNLYSYGLYATSGVMANYFQTVYSGLTSTWQTLVSGLSITNYAGTGSPIVLNSSSFTSMVLRDGISTNNVLTINRNSSMSSNSVTGNLISVFDNPTNYIGVVSGKVLSATIGTTERISLNPRATSTAAYWFDTHNELTQTIFAIGNQGDTVLKVSADSGLQVSKLTTDTLTIGDSTVTGFLSLNEAVSDEVFDSLTAEVAYIKTKAHGFFAFEDSSVVIDCPADTWVQVTNSTNDLFTAVQDGEGFDISGDTITFNQTDNGLNPHIILHWGVDGHAAAGEDYEVRMYNIDNADGVVRKAEGSTDGANNRISIGTTSYDASADYGDRYILQINNKTDSDDFTIENGSVYLEVSHY